jgi:hypothetical protein
MARIVTSHENASVARAIERSLRADNEDAPKPLKIRSKAIGRRLISTINYAQDVESLLTTIDDLLLCAVAVERTLSSVKLKGTELHRRPRVSSSRAPKV